MYTKILVPLDGSELSECSLEHLKQVGATGDSAEVILMRVIEPITPNEAAAWSSAGYMIADVTRKNKEAATEYLTQIAEKLQNQDISAKVEVIEGRIAEAILDYVEKNQVELVIISTHGRSGISRWTFGSVADKVVRHSPVPILVIAPAGCRLDK
ncbi:MAG: universal stress protein [Dehalococcoidales bacterium]|nr:universal stress protein [Dehalococcoidales bacterium]